MEQIKPSLFLNYERQIGRRWKGNSLGVDSEFETSYVRRFKEILIPAAGRDASSTLDAISNAIFVEARRQNMSLSPYGHLDPVKFAIANTYLGLMMAEVKRGLGISCRYEFANTQFGATLALAAGIDIHDILSGNHYTDYCSRFNRLAARINNLMIPHVKLFNKWLKHRVTVYKDDEGDRYSLYLYKMANIYYYDTDPESKTVGQLLFKNMDELDTEADHRNYITLGVYMDYIEKLLERYEADDDLVSFSTEAIKAGMSHLVIDPIPADGDSFAKVELNVAYELDDIMGLENAKFVWPIYGSFSALTGTEVTLSWNIIEDPTTNKFRVGEISNKVNTGRKRQTFGLPVVVPFRIGASVTVNNGFTFDLDKCPTFTHAKIKSVEGLTSLTNYIVGVKKADLDATMDFTSLGSYFKVICPFGNSGVSNDTLDFGHDMFHTVTTAYSDYRSKLIFELTCFNTEMLVSVECFNSESNLTSLSLPIVFNTLVKGALDHYYDSLVLQFLGTTGFKARFYLYAFVNDAKTVAYPMFADYDYIVAVPEESLSNYFIANAWNNSQIA